MALRTVGVRLTAEISDYQRKLREAGQSTKTFVGETEKAARAGHLDRVADSAGAVGLALGGMAAYAVKSAADFEKSMSAVSAATHAGAAEMKQLREAALQAGKDTQYSATGAADAITQLSKAGIATADILNGGLRGALSLAAAGQLDVGEAAETAASAMTQFKLSGDKVPHVADLLAAAAGKAQGSVHDVGMALNQAGLVASQFGLSIEDTTGVLAQFANAGLTGSDAGTSFKTMLLALSNPSTATRKQMDELGISFYDAQGQFVGLGGVAQILQTRLKGLTEEQRNAALGQIFGNDAIRAASILYRDGAAGVEKWKTAVNDAGYASETAAKLTDNLAGDLERLKGSVETLAIESGSGANGGLRILVQMVGSLVDQISALPPVVGSTVTVLAGLSGGAALLAAGWLKTRKLSADFRGELEAMGPAGQRAASGMSKLSGAATKVGVVFASLEVAGAVISQFQDDLKPQTEALAVGLENYATSGQLAGESSRVLGGDLDKLQGKFQILADDTARNAWARNLQGALESIVPGLKGTDESLARTKERIGSVDAALAQMVSSGNTQGANTAFQKLAGTLATGGVSMAELRAQFPQYAASLETATTATKGASGATHDLSSALGAGETAERTYATAADAAAGAVRGQRDALVDLSNKLRAETDPVFGLLDAQDQLTEAQKRVATATKEHGSKSREADAANRDLAKAAINLNEKVGNLSTTFSGKMTPQLVATLRAAGLTDAQIKTLGGQFKDAKKKGDDFAKKYQASVAVDGYAAAIGKLDRLSVYQQALKTGKIPTGFHGPIKGPDGKYYATGGPVAGPGTGTSDSIPAWLSNGEHVWTAAEVAAAGGQDAVIQLRTAIMSGKRVEVGDETPGFATGGPVRWPYPTTVSKARIPSRAEVAGAVIPDAPSGGQTYKWILQVVRSAFPGLHAISTYRPGAVTLTGNRSYHAVGRAVDYPASRALAEWVNAHYFSRTKELITPWNSLNIWNGRRHTYTGAVWNQHNFAGGNAHDHWAMKGGGTITEPIFGVGASGRTYSFGENYQPERVIPNWHGAGGSGTNVTIVLENRGVIGSRMEVETMLAGAVDNLKRKGRL